MQFGKGGPMPGIPITPKPIDVSQTPGTSKGLNKPDSAQPGKFDSVLKTTAQNNSISQPTHITPNQNVSPINASTKVQEVKKTSGAERVQKSKKSSPVENLFSSLVNSQDQLNGLVNMSMSGQTFSSQQMITMQAGVYKSTMMLDVAGKGVEQITSGLKTLFQTQV